MKYGNTEIVDAKQAPGSDTVQVTLADRAQLDVHKDIFEKVTHGRSYTFPPSMKWETTRDRQRREAEEREAQAGNRIP